MFTHLSTFLVGSSSLSELSESEPDILDISPRIKQSILFIEYTAVNIWNFRGLK